MAELILSEQSLRRLRILPHALWELLAGARLLARQHGAPQFPYRLWIRAAMASLNDDRSSALVRWASTWPDDEVPRFLLPHPQASTLDLDQACDEMLSWSPASVRERLRRQYRTQPPAAYSRFEEDTESAVVETAVLIRDFAKNVLAPHWPEVAETVRDEVAYRGRVLADSGVDGLLERLHTRIRWANSVLDITGLGEYRTATSWENVVLVPLLFARDQVILHSAADGMLAIGYQARGATNLATRLAAQTAERLDCLALLLGKTRAAVLKSLTTPCTTTAVARSLRLAPSTVSEHLALLVSSRVVVRTRRSNEVYYRLSAEGVALLRSLAGEGHEPSGPVSLR